MMNGQQLFKWICALVLLGARENDSVLTKAPSYIREKASYFSSPNVSAGDAFGLLDSDHQAVVMEWYEKMHFPLPGEVRAYMAALAEKGIAV